MIERDHFEFYLRKVAADQFVDKTNSDAVSRKTIRAYFTRIVARETTITLCVLRKQGVTLAVGAANLNPYDRYQRMVGNKLALARAVRNFVEGIFNYREDCDCAIRLIWEAVLATGYFDKPKNVAPVIDRVILDETATIEVAA